MTYSNTGWEKWNSNLSPTTINESSIVSKCYETNSAWISYSQQSQVHQGWLRRLKSSFVQCRTTGCHYPFLLSSSIAMSSEQHYTPDGMNLSTHFAANVIPTTHRRITSSCYWLQLDWHRLLCLERNERLTLPTYIGFPSHSTSTAVDAVKQHMPVEIRPLLGAIASTNKLLSSTKCGALFPLFDSQVPCLAPILQEWPHADGIVI